MSKSKILAALTKLNVSPDTIKLVNECDNVKITRPGTYRGTHFYDLQPENELMWATAKNGGPCGTDCWFIVQKKEGDTYKRGGVCDGGMDWYIIYLSA